MYYHFLNISHVQMIPTSSVDGQNNGFMCKIQLDRLP